jgi:hypothetical protein
MIKKSFLKILNLMMIIVLCSSCKISNKNNITNITNEVSLNSMLTKMPVFKDENHFYYAENGKILKDITNDIEIDKCSNAIISDIYYNNNFLYYTKQDDEKIDMIVCDTKDYNNKKVLFTITNSIGFGMGDDFIYVNNDDVYYYNYLNQILYKYQNDNLDKVLENVTSVTFNDDDIYYSTTEQKIFKTDFDLKNATEIFDSNNIKENVDEFLQRWIKTSFNEYSVIKDIAIYQGKVVFRFCGDLALNKGVLMYINGTKCDYFDFASVISYQLNGNSLVGYGSIYSESNENKIFITNINKSIVQNIKTYNYIYVSNGNLYYQVPYESNEDIWEIHNIALKK